MKIVLFSFSLSPALASGKGHSIVKPMFSEIAELFSLSLYFSLSVSLFLGLFSL
jgi:hypothetical protein